MRNRKNGRRAIVALLACIATLLGSSACGWASEQTSQPQPSTSTTQASEKITVVATLNQWGSLANSIGKDKVSVTSIMSSSTADTHNFAPTSKQVSTMRKAQVLVSNGAGYDSWADKGQSEDTTLVSVADTVGAMEGDNPHLWFSKDARQAVAKELTEVFSRLQPSSKSYFEKNLKQWQTNEKELESTLSERSKELKNPTYAATEDVAYYLMSDLGFTDVTPKNFAQAVTGGDELTSADTKEFEKVITDGQTKLLICDSQAKTDADDTLTKDAKEKKIPVVTVTETMPKDQKTLLDWIESLGDTIISQVEEEESTQEKSGTASPSPSASSSTSGSERSK